MHLHKQKLTKYFRGHYIIMVGVTNFKELGVTFSCSVFAAFFWELPKNFPHVWLQQCKRQTMVQPTQVTKNLRHSTILAKKRRNLMKIR